jgi:hypothetical protein
MRKTNGIELHSFYCMNCGNKAYDLARPISHRYSKHHRKRLYCPWCKMTVNCIECRNDAEVYEFKEAFSEGAYKEELQECLDYINNSMELIKG